MTLIPTESQKELFPIIEGLKVENEKLKKDSQLLDWLQEIMTDDGNYCEVFLCGLRNWTGKAHKFQIESNPEKFPVIQCDNIRELIIQAKRYYNGEPF